MQCSFYSVIFNYLAHGILGCGNITETSPKRRSQHIPWHFHLLSFPALCETREQILANHFSDWWHIWRSASGLYLPTHGSVWIPIFRTGKGFFLVLPPSVQVTDLMPLPGAFDKQEISHLLLQAHIGVLCTLYFCNLCQDKCKYSYHSDGSWLMEEWFSLVLCFIFTSWCSSCLGWEPFSFFAQKILGMLAALTFSVRSLQMLEPLLEIQ
jgi:hypothetical protein